MKKIVIFASGSGSNAENIIRHFNPNPEKGAKVVALYANRPTAYALTRAESLNVPTRVFDKSAFYGGNEILNELRRLEADWVVLAGFLWLMPQNLVEAFPNKIINIHPALLPKYGGRGMYGEHVHRAVVAAGEKESGITIHYVNAEYDSGSTIFQATCPVLPGDTPDALAARIHGLEQEHFPKIIEGVISLK